MSSFSKVFLLTQIGLQALVAFLNPNTEGLYPFAPQILPFIGAIPFLFFKKGRSSFIRGLYIFSIVSFAFLALDYLISSHLGLIHLAITFVPPLLLWLVYFIKWNYRHVKSKDSLEAFGLASISWGLYALAFPPLPLGVGGFIFLVPWFIVLQKKQPSAALFATFWSGVLYNAINYYWIYNVMKVGPAGFILMGLFLLIAYFSAYNVLAAFVFIQAQKIKIKGRAVLVWLFPLFYAGLEMTRTKGDFSFPWSHLGYVLGNHLSLLQTLSWIGIFGYTVLIIASNMAVTRAFIEKKFRFLIFTPIVILLCLWLHGTIVLSSEEAQPFYEKPSEKSPTIAMVQPSISQTKKWSKAYFDSVTTKTWNLVDEYPTLHEVDILVLAETAIPDILKRHRDQIRHIRKVANENGLNLLVGALDYDRIERENHSPLFKLYNSSFLFYPESLNKKEDRYIKQHLVPFSERIPFDDVFPILNYVDFGEGDFTPGTETPVYEPFAWTPYICYEAIFGDQIRRAIRNGSRLMINITNDGWFGKSTAPGQHLNLIRYRAIENGYPVARNANSGISVFIDQYGHFDKKTDLYEETVITRKVPLRTRDTFYTHIGDAIEIGLLIFFSAYLLYILLPLITNKLRSLKNKKSERH
jgi:apolipoprotein N-acyltransferase